MQHVSSNTDVGQEAPSYVVATNPIASIFGDDGGNDDAFDIGMAGQVMVGKEEDRHQDRAQENPLYSTTYAMDGHTYDHRTHESFGREIMEEKKREGEIAHLKEETYDQDGLNRGDNTQAQEQQRQPMEMTGGYSETYYSQQYHDVGENVHGEEQSNYQYGGAVHNTVPTSGNVFDGNAVHVNDGQRCADGTYQSTYGGGEGTGGGGEQFEGQQQEFHQQQQSNDQQEFHQQQQPYDQQEFHQQQQPYDQQEFHQQQQSYDQQEFHQQQQPYDQQEFHQQQQPYDQQEFHQQQQPYDQQEFHQQQQSYDQQEFYQQQQPYDQQEFRQQQQSYDQQDFHQQQQSYDQQDFHQQQQSYDQQEFHQQQQSYDQQQMGDGYKFYYQESYHDGWYGQVEGNTAIETAANPDPQHETYRYAEDQQQRQTNGGADAAYFNDDETGGDVQKDLQHDVIESYDPVHAHHQKLDEKRHEGDMQETLSLDQTCGSSDQRGDILDEFKDTANPRRRTDTNVRTQLVERVLGTSSIDFNSTSSSENGTDVQRDMGQSKQKSRDVVTQRLNPNLQAGRRKLEEFKRKKAAALSRRTTSATKISEKCEDQERGRKDGEELRQLRSELQSLNRELEIVDGERNALQREKAALMGELMELKSCGGAKVAAAHTEDQIKAIELLKEELDDVKNRAQHLEQKLAEARHSCDMLQDSNTQLKKEIDSYHINHGNMLKQESTEVTMLRETVNKLEAELYECKKREEGLHSQLFNQKNKEEDILSRNKEILQEYQENIDSLREMIAEGEQERAGLLRTIETLKADTSAGATMDTTVNSFVSQRNEQLAHLEEEISQLRLENEGLKLQAENAVTKDTHAASPSSPGFDGSGSLQARLAKAEAAVEGERRRVHELERRLQEGETEITEANSLKQQIMEYRRREEELERQLAVLQSQSSTDPVVAAPPFSQEALDAALQRADEAEKSCELLKSQLTSSSQTIMKLTDEVDELTSRLNKQADTIAALAPPSHNASQLYTITSSAQPMYQTSHGAVPFFGSQQESNEFEEIDYQNQASDASRQYNEQTGSYGGSNVVPTHETTPRLPDNGMSQQQQPDIFQHHQDINNGWTVPGASVIDPQSSQEEAAEKPKKKIGFWQWVAGADLASHD